LLKLDANSSFWQIKLAQDSKLLATFITSFGRYEFNLLPIGLYYSIIKMIDGLPKGKTQILEGVFFSYTDDVLIFGLTEYLTCMLS
jgi:hypothetical protein